MNLKGVAKTFLRKHVKPVITGLTWVLFLCRDDVFAMPIFTESAEDKMTNMTIILMSMSIILMNMKNTLRKKNVTPMTTVDCFHFVTEGWGYVFVEKGPTVFSHVAVDVIAEENRMAFVTPEQEDVPAAMT